MREPLHPPREPQPSKKELKKALKDLEQTMRLMEHAVIGCVQLRRWEDLRAAVAEYGQALRIDPGRLLITLLFRDFTRRLLAMPDSDFVRHVPDAMVGFAMTIDPLSLDEMIPLLADASRHLPLFRIFDAMDSSGETVN